MSQHVQQASAWVYRGVWRFLSDVFKVPEHPPTLPVPPGETLESFRPSLGFLRYLKFLFWLRIGPVIFGLVMGEIMLGIFLPWLAGILLIPELLFVLGSLVLGYVAIHLRYDSTWYVMTSRSLRVRRGIWTIHETTITFENVQNVEVSQGPLQRYFDIASVRVDTAGGGKPAGHQGGASEGHRGLIEGISDAPRIRDLILSRLQRSMHAGLGDEGIQDERGSGLTAKHVAVLREIRDLVTGASAS